jgi:hypothetical protein
MAYNISVATHTEEERWEWVNAGIRLVRNEGLRYNPNDMTLHRELAFWFAHKIEGLADDAHLYYKAELCREWHWLLGAPPQDFDQYLAWLGKVADAPEDLASVENQSPEAAELLRALREMSTDKFNRELKLDRAFLEHYSQWDAVTHSAAAKSLGIDQQSRAEHPAFAAFDALATSPRYAQAWDALIAHVRKRVLEDEYNMDPARMRRYAQEFGVPIDWRHGCAHSLYWSRKGSEMGAGRVDDDDVYIILNNDSQVMQAMQDLARSGQIFFDPFSSDNQGRPMRFPDPRWIDAIDANFEPMYAKHYNVRGAGGERFITFLKNFMASAICEWYRAGERPRALALMRRLDNLFGSGALRTTEYKDAEQTLDVFVKNHTYDLYQAQPHLAPRDIWASLTYGYRMAFLYNQPQVLADAIRFANEVTTWYKENHWNDFVSKFGTGRMKDIVGELEDSAEFAYLLLLTSPAMRMQDRMAIWANTDRIEAEVNKRPPVLRAMVYDQMMPALRQQFVNHELGASMTVDQAFPAPPGLDAARQMLADRKARREKEKAENMERERIAPR